MVTTDHALYHDVASVEGLPEAVKRPKHPQDPKRALAIRETLGGEIGDSWWALCCTGMLPDEFFSGKWAVEDGRVHVKGTKREARDRFVPLLTELRPSTMTKQRFERAQREAGLGVRPKDGRDSFALWCDVAGIPQGWKRALMGHQAENVTQEYGWQESERILNEAEAKLRTLLACQNNTRQTGGHSTRESRKSHAPRRTRTPSLLIRSQALYPVELWAPLNPCRDGVERRRGTSRRQVAETLSGSEDRGRRSLRGTSSTSSPTSTRRPGISASSCSLNVFPSPSQLGRREVGGTRLELVTSTMSTWRSNQLS